MGSRNETINKKEKVGRIVEIDEMCIQPKAKNNEADVNESLSYYFAFLCKFIKRDSVSAWYRVAYMYFISDCK